MWAQYNYLKFKIKVMKDAQRKPSPTPLQDQINNQVDNKFIAMMLEVEKKYQAPHATF
jgi:hypothetical protein